MKLTRDESTPEKRAWWAKVVAAAASAPKLEVVTLAASDPVRHGWILFSEGGLTWYEHESAEPPCAIWIESRPHYCDRGRWLAKLDARGDLDIDASDGWPRYYFDLTVAFDECEAWLTFRAASRAKRQRKT